MVKISVYNLEGKEVGELKLDPKVFDVEINPALIHQVVSAQQANARQVLAHTKTKAEVRGGGKKPWKQKGTGRARQGSTRNPQWVGGGVAFGPRKDRNFSQKINKKMRRKALFMTLTDKVKDNNLIVLDSFSLPSIKTKSLVSCLNKLPIKNKSVLAVLSKKDEIISKSARNLSKVKTILADSLNVIDVMHFNYLLIDKEGIKKISATYQQ